MGPTERHRPAERDGQRDRWGWDPQTDGLTDEQGWTHSQGTERQTDSPWAGQQPDGDRQTEPWGQTDDAFASADGKTNRQSPAGTNSPSTGDRRSPCLAPEGTERHSPRGGGGTRTDSAPGGGTRPDTAPFGLARRGHTDTWPLPSPKGAEGTKRGTVAPRSPLHSLSPHLCTGGAQGAGSGRGGAQPRPLLSPPASPAPLQLHIKQGKRSRWEGAGGGGRGAKNKELSLGSPAPGPRDAEGTGGRP